MVVKECEQEAWHIGQVLSTLVCSGQLLYLPDHVWSSKMPSWNQSPLYVSESRTPRGMWTPNMPMERMISFPFRQVTVWTQCQYCSPASRVTAQTREKWRRQNPPWDVYLLSSKSKQNFILKFYEIIHRAENEINTNKCRCPCPSALTVTTWTLAVQENLS